MSDKTFDPAAFARLVEDYATGRAGGSTPAGLPYPLPSEPVQQGAAAIQALATALDPSLVGSYRIHNAVDTVSVGTGIWSGLGITTFEAGQGTDLGGSGNGILVNRAGTYQATLMIQSGNGTNVTVTIGVAKSTSNGPSGTIRVSNFANNSGISNVGTWLMQCAAGDIIIAFVTHNNAGNLAFTTRRLSLHRIGN